MNILQVVSRLDTSDAAEDVIVSTRAFTLNGHKVCVASEKSTFVKEIDEVGARHYTVSIKPNIFLIPIAIFRLSQIILKEDIHIVHARDGLSSFLSFFASRFTDRVFITTVYGHYTKGFFAKAQFWGKRVICFDENTSHHLTKRGFVTHGKIRVIPPFVSIDAFGPHTKDQHFVVGAVLPLASFEVTQSFIKTVSILSRTIYRMKVFIIDSTLRHEKKSIEKIKLLMRRYSLSSIMSFLPQEEIEALLPKLDLFVQVNTDRNPFIRLLLEAGAHGIPVVTTQTEWMKEYIEDKKSAFLVCQSNDPKELASAILDLYKNENLRKEMVSEAQKFIMKKFNIKKIMESTLNLYGDALSSMNILIIKIGALGDVILAVPSFRAIRKKFPKSKITMLIGRENREVFMNSPFIDEIIVCDFKERDRGLGGLLRIAKKLRAEDFDMVIDLQNNKKSHLLAFLSCAAKRYGYDNGKLSFLLNRKIKDAKIPVDPIKHQSRVLGLLGICNIDKKLELWTSKEDEVWADDFLTSHWIKGNTKLIAFNVGSSPRWITKLWPLEYFVEVCNKLAKGFGVRTVLIGREKQDLRIEEFLKRAKCKPIDASGKTNIPRLAALMRKCNLLLSSDSAPLHVASSVNVPFIGLFGPTDPDRHLAPAVKDSIVFKKDIKCSPCYRTRCDKGLVCMRSIKPDEVYKAILKLVGI